MFGCNWGSLSRSRTRDTIDYSVVLKLPHPTSTCHSLRSCPSGNIRSGRFNRRTNIRSLEVPQSTIFQEFQRFFPLNTQQLSIQKNLYTIEIGDTHRASVAPRRIVGVVLTETHSSSIAFLRGYLGSSNREWVSHVRGASQMSKALAAALPGSAMTSTI